MVEVNGRVNQVLIGKKTFIPIILDHFPINSTSTSLDQYPITFRSLLKRCLVDRHSTFLTVRNNHAGNPIDADYPDRLIELI